MRSFTKLLLAALLLSSVSYAYAKPHITVKADTMVNIDRNLSGFTSIKIAGPFEVHLTQGSAETIKFEAPPEIVNRMVAEVEGGVLKISRKHDNWSWGYNSWWSDKSWWNHHKRIVVFVTAKALDAITISGSGDVTFNDGIKANSLQLIIHGSGEMTGKVDVQELKSKISGSGGMKLSGKAGNSTVRVTGSGHFTSRDLITMSSAAHVSGSGRAEVNASNEVKAAVHGSGGISYTGTAKIVNSSKSGSGEINRF